VAGLDEGLDWESDDVKYIATNIATTVAMIARVVEWETRELLSKEIFAVLPLRLILVSTSTATNESKDDYYLMERRTGIQLVLVIFINKFLTQTLTQMMSLMLDLPHLSLSRCIIQSYPIIDFFSPIKQSTRLGRSILREDARTGW
jgi:hypothetical protein